MSLKVCVLGSGSTGNCIFVSSETTAVLVDMGLPCARVKKCLSVLSSPKVKAILLTHEHVDHISGVASFVKSNNDVDVVCHSSCYYGIKRRLDVDVRQESGDFYVGDLTVSPFRVQHDVPCVGYGILCGGIKVGIVTDVGKLTESVVSALSGSSLVVIECNHDEQMLEKNENYSSYLKRRIASSSGHASNAECAVAVRKLAAGGVKRFILAHLSRENNYPELAFDTCMKPLVADGLLNEVSIEVALPDRMTGLYEIV